MTAEQVARFVLSDGQDSELRALIEREMDAQLAESLKDPVFKARWDANLRAFGDDISRRVAEVAYDATCTINDYWIVTPKQT